MKREKFEVRYAKVKDALGRIREGWIIFEDGMPGYPYETEEKAKRERSRAMPRMRERGEWLRRQCGT